VLVLVIDERSQSGGPIPGTVDFQRTCSLSGRRRFDDEHEHRRGATEHEHDLS
jgi:hypothetical protein